MEYERIEEIIGDIKYHYLETGEWHSSLCSQLIEMTRHVPLMVSNNRGVKTEDIPDIIQQSYQSAFRYLAKLQDDRSFPRYLFTIADNLCRKYWRKKKQTGYQEQLEYGEGRPVSMRPSMNQYNRSDLRENLRDAVSKLPDTYRETIELFYFAGLKAREIASELDISTNTVTSRMRRGRIMLKEILEA